MEVVKLEAHKRNWISRYWIQKRGLQEKILNDRQFNVNVKKDQKAQDNGLLTEQISIINDILNIRSSWMSSFWRMSSRLPLGHILFSTHMCPGSTQAPINVFRFS